MGFVVKSDNAGKIWQDFTAYLPDPPNDWGDDPAPTAGELTYLQIHGDIHNKDTFYLLAEWTEPGGDWRGWLYKTTDGCFSWTTTSLYSYVSGGNILKNGDFDTDLSFWTVTGGVDWEDGQAKFRFAALKNSYIDQVCTFVDGTYLVIATFDRNSPDYTREVYISFVGSGLPITWPDPETGKKAGTIAMSAGPNTVRFFAPYQGGVPGGLYGYGDDVAIYLVASAVQARPLAMDLDTKDGGTLYLTAWFDGALSIQVIDTDDLEKVGGYELGTATEAEVADRDQFIFPRAPHVPGVANFDDRVYAAGRFDHTGTVKRLMYSDDRCVSFSDVGDPAWGTGTSRIGAMEVFTDDQHILAIMNDASPSLWETLDQGAAWSQINTVPFNVEFEALSKHWGEAAELLIGSNAPGGWRAATLEAPYTGAWTDASTGLPDNEIVSIIWV